jgi:glycosyltransferase involved in cell wall biosynthesis
MNKIKPKELNLLSKPIILIITGHYLPGYKAGGVLRNILNTVDNLCDEFEFKIITRDRDLGDNFSFPSARINEWQKVGNASVYYLSPRSESINCLYNLIETTQHHLIYLTSYFDPLTIKVLLNRKFRRSIFKPVIVAPFGEFAAASFEQKYIKKIAYIQVATLWGLYKNVTWRVSSDYEANDVKRVLKVNADSIHITGDLPIKNIPEVQVDQTLKSFGKSDGLKIVFLSRIAREKNLDFALRILAKVGAPVCFDIYGPAENRDYWDECQALIAKLPANVKVRYLGSVNPDQILQVFSQYDLFLFPSGGEAYGNVIAEALTAGTPVLISTETPWRNLQVDGLGWDISLEKFDAFVEVIESFSLLTDQQRTEIRSAAKIKILERLFDPEVLESNRQLFSKQLE